MKSRVWILSVGLVLQGLGCSTFDRDWDASTNTDGIEGRWVGRWHSDHNQHNDVLRCLITRKEGRIYSTRFHAKYKLLSFLPISYRYGLDMTVTEDNGQYQFQGQADLGKLAGGLYRYAGSGTTNQLQFNYRSSRDHGTFNLQHQKEGE
ncbi:hypothetical protein OAK45_06795 [Verrucomicrobia bacterium]|nr:hypothetical protein [Verrucomicrobiota bacterium]MDC0219006.1 hypothetical protein [Verrucomicrobiota bacterium]